MATQDDKVGTERVARAHARSTSPVRRSVPRTVLFLLLAALVLLVFILQLGNRRRQIAAMQQMQVHAVTCEKRLGTLRPLPINLEPDAGAKRLGVRPLVWLSRTEARCLRESDSRILVAYTSIVRQQLATDGVAALFFKDGRFETVWLTRIEWLQASSDQAEELRRCEAGAVDADG